MGTAYNPKIVTDGLVLCLDAANPKSYPGSGTSWTDLSGNGNNGTLVNGVGYSSSNSGYLTFNGSTHGVELDSAPQLFSNSVTMIGWFYFNESNVRDVLFGNHDTTPAVNFERHTSNRLRLYWNTGANDIFTGNNVSLANVWQQICIVRNKEISKFQFYVNSIIVSDQNVTSADIATVSGTFRIGRDVRTDNTATNGNISKFCLYNRALTAQEIQQNFNATRGRYGI
jgi:hypothetical protein